MDEGQEGGRVGCQSHLSPPTVSPMDTDVKFLNKVLANNTQQSIKRIIHYNRGIYSGWKA